MEISFPQASQAAWEGVKERGWGYVYQPKKVKHTYFHGFNKPGCHVGFVLNQLGKKFMFGYRNRMCIGGLLDFSLIKVSPEANYFLKQLQVNNDSSVMWGPGYFNALESTLGAFPHLRREPISIPTRAQAMGLSLVS